MSQGDVHRWSESDVDSLPDVCYPGVCYHAGLETVVVVDDDHRRMVRDPGQIEGISAVRDDDERGYLGIARTIGLKGGHTPLFAPAVVSRRAVSMNDQPSITGVVRTSEKPPTRPTKRARAASL